MRQLIGLIFRKRNRWRTVVVIGKLYDAKLVSKVNGGIVAGAISRICRVVTIFIVGVVGHFVYSPLKIRCSNFTLPIVLALCAQTPCQQPQPLTGSFVRVLFLHGQDHLEKYLHLFAQSPKLFLRHDECFSR